MRQKFDKRATNRPFAGSYSCGTNSPCCRAKVALGQDKQKTYIILNGNFLCLSCPSATFALQHGGCVPREWLAAKGLLMLTPPSPHPTGMWLLENFYYLKVTVQIKRLVFTHMAICRAHWLQGKAFTKRKNSTPTGFVWEANMAAILLFWETNMADLSSSVTSYNPFQAQR